MEELRAYGDEIEGVTISGGEPFQQPAALFSLLHSIRSQSHLSVLLFTGYTQRELDVMPHSADILGCIDVLISGRYRSSMRSASNLIGSTNKSMSFLTDRYSITDFVGIPEAELWIGTDGRLEFSGIDPIAW